mmetsp:Transcript_12282/g.20892  ORF Transcript_12282/g.20892 Transcript_12282/m.20892 type:complete len:442 (+) Transcript_12282:411-1736(+)
MICFSEWMTTASRGEDDGWGQFVDIEEDHHNEDVDMETEVSDCSNGPVYYYEMTSEQQTQQQHEITMVPPHERTYTRPQRPAPVSPNHVQYAPQQVLVMAPTASSASTSSASSSASSSSHMRPEMQPQHSPYQPQYVSNNVPDQRNPAAPVYEERRPDYYHQQHTYHMHQQQYARYAPHAYPAQHQQHPYHMQSHPHQHQNQQQQQYYAAQNYSKPSPHGVPQQMMPPGFNPAEESSRCKRRSPVPQHNNLVMPNHHLYQQQHHQFTKTVMLPRKASSSMEESKVSSFSSSNDPSLVQPQGPETPLASPSTGSRERVDLVFGKKTSFEFVQQQQQNHYNHHQQQQQQQQMSQNVASEILTGNEEEFLNANRTPEEMVEILIQLHPVAGCDLETAMRLRQQFLRAAPEKQVATFQAAILTAKRLGRHNLLAELEAQPTPICL